VLNRRVLIPKFLWRKIYEVKIFYQQW